MSEGAGILKGRLQMTFEGETFAAQTMMFGAEMKAWQRLEAGLECT
jgi:hypothetical protein